MKTDNKQTDVPNNKNAKRYGTYKTKTMNDLSYDKKAGSAFKTIGEVAKILDVEQHVLRFWETKFSAVKPMKRGGNRRYYRPDDIELLQAIHKLLYQDKYTIKGVQKLFKEKGKTYILDQYHGISEPYFAQQTEPSAPPHSSTSELKGLSQSQRNVLRGVLNDLKTMRDMLQTS